MILAIETSTGSGSLAVVKEGQILFEQAFRAERSHSSELFVALESAVEWVRKCDTVAVG